MPKTIRKKDIKVKVNIQIGGPVSNYQHSCWKKWWSARISEAKQGEGKNEQ